ncbi:Jacalin-like lectin domain superfamily [Arabidopsis thaliana x Arabidopsis arenosa]|uniref:Jacalin-like lectin domain superfamily n=1 Tax=Arabidopsis thaliana x Arabidopsis arenosa TaxID=1240361 RepID=A0A8T1YBU0_9BRAS|nr:Jacalin-like lectin domain superfamily [Arabidopsis thaliana x Arabidopsis arenosa]
MALMVKAQGGNGGKEWDDGFNYEGVTKIHVRAGYDGIQFIKFEYVKAGKTIVGPIHGVSGLGMTQTFEINLQKEYLVSVEGYYDKSTGVIQSIQFKTNEQTSDLMGFNKGTKFSLGTTRRKIIGFHGFADKKVYSLGAYFIRIPATKSAMQGGQTTGKGYDDGGEYDGIRKVYVTYDGTSIRNMRVDYDKAGQVECYEYGDKNGTEDKITVNYPYECITSVEGSYAVTQPYGCIVLRSLTFKTSNGRTLVIGTVTGTKFSLQSEGNAIVGFHGRVGSCVDSIGAYYAPFFPSPLPTEKLEGQGGDGGDSWDDGAFLNVKKVYIGQGTNGIVAVKFEYENDASEVVFGDEHGKTTLLGYEDFKLDYPSEYIIAVEGCHDKIMGVETGVITMLRFKTNNRTSQPFGLEAGVNFVLQKEGHKIIGFHGKSSTMLHQIGVHVVPITK